MLIKIKFQYKIIITFDLKSEVPKAETLDRNLFKWEVPDVGFLALFWKSIKNWECFSICISKLFVPILLVLISTLWILSLSFWLMNIIIRIFTKYLWIIWSYCSLISSSFESKLFIVVGFGVFKWKT